MSRAARVVRRLAIGVAAAAIAVLAASWLAAGPLLDPVNHPVVAAPTGWPATTVSLPSASGTTLRGWWSPGAAGKGAVLLLHGIRADRASMVGRARFLHDAGYGVLAIDLQGHGESPGKRITLGYLESRDARAAVTFLREHAAGERIGLIGVSMGGAAAVLADPPLDIDALVLEQVYPTIRNAVGNRLDIKFGRGGHWLSPLLLWQFRPRLGIGVDDLRPIDHIARLPVAKLVVAAEHDAHTLLADSQALYAAAAAPKEWWLVPDATHEDLHARLGSVYEARIDAFLGRWLRSNTP